MKNNLDYSKKGLEVQYQFLKIAFRGNIEYFDPKIGQYKIKVSNWFGEGYPHLFYYSKSQFLIFNEKENNK